MGNDLNRVLNFEVLKLKGEGGGDDKVRPKMAKFENSRKINKIEFRHAVFSIAFFIS